MLSLLHNAKKKRKKKTWSGRNILFNSRHLHLRLQAFTFKYEPLNGRLQEAPFDILISLTFRQTCVRLTQQ